MLCCSARYGREELLHDPETGVLYRPPAPEDGDGGWPTPVARLRTVAGVAKVVMFEDGSGTDVRNFFKVGWRDGEGGRPVQQRRAVRARPRCLDILLPEYLPSAGPGRAVVTTK